MKKYHNLVPPHHHLQKLHGRALLPIHLQLNAPHPCFPICYLKTYFHFNFSLIQFNSVNSSYINSFYKLSIKTFSHLIYPTYHAYWRSISNLISELKIFKLYVTSCRLHRSNKAKIWYFLSLPTCDKYLEWQNLHYFLFYVDPLTPNECVKIDNFKPC